MSITEIKIIGIDKNGGDVKKKVAKSNIDIVKNYGEEKVNTLFKSFIQEIGFEEYQDPTRSLIGLYMNVKLPNVSIIEDGNNFVSVMINQQDVTPKIYMDWQYDKKSSDYYSLKDIKSVENLKPFYTIDKGKKKLEYNFEEFFNLILEGARKAWGVGNKLGANW